MIVQSCIVCWACTPQSQFNDQEWIQCKNDDIQCQNNVNTKQRSEFGMTVQYLSLVLMSIWIWYFGRFTRSSGNGQKIGIFGIVINFRVVLKCYQWMLYLVLFGSIISGVQNFFKIYLFIKNSLISSTVSFLEWNVINMKNQQYQFQCATNMRQILFGSDLCQMFFFYLCQLNKVSNMKELKFIMNQTTTRSANIFREAFKCHVRWAELKLRTKFTVSTKNDRNLWVRCAF